MSLGSGQSMCGFRGLCMAEAAGLVHQYCHSTHGNQPPETTLSVLVLLTLHHVLQVKELEELCAAQQNSLEEGEEKFRALQDEQDQLHHAALAAKAQLVTAQAQVR